MQRQSHLEDNSSSQNTNRKSGILSSGGNPCDSSPFNTKFTVLKFNNQSSIQQQYNSSPFGTDSSRPRGLFSNSLNYNNHGTQESFSQCSQSSMSHSGSLLSENTSPVLSQHAFKHNPLNGFDEDSLIVPKKKQRKIQKIPYKVLDAPALQDDFYLNLVDWSSENNLAVGLSSCIYIWSASSGKVTKLHDLGPRDCVTSACWSKQGQHLSIGTNSGVV